MEFEVGDAVNPLVEVALGGDVAVEPPPDAGLLRDGDAVRCDGGVDLTIRVSMRPACPNTTPMCSAAASPPP